MLNTLIWCGDAELGMERTSPQTLGASHPLLTKDIGQVLDWHINDDPYFKGHIASIVWNRHRFNSDVPRLMACGPCMSTMTVARSLAEKNLLFTWDALIALSQHGGCGQYGRQWISPPGNIYSSFILPSLKTLNKRQNWAPVLSLVCGYALCTAFEESGFDVRLKWPNDLVLNDHKIGGILVTIKDQVPICGVGINVSSSPSDNQLRSDHAMKASTINSVGSYSTPIRLWEKIYSKSIEIIIKTIDYFTIYDLMNSLSQKIIWTGICVLIALPGEAPFEAFIQGLAGDGGLIVRKGTKYKTIYSGSITPI